MARILKEDAERWLGRVPNEYAFWCCDGRTIHDMAELAESLQQMEESIFDHHSNKQRKDFSNWVRDVIGDQKLARDLMKAGTLNQAARAVNQRVQFLQIKIS
ncbi:MAG: hypothetical protein R6U89_08520 [Dehalococcoidia bacterium]